MAGTAELVVLVELLPPPPQAARINAANKAAGAWGLNFFIVKLPNNQ
jgi:hypothetical protein